MKNIKQQEPVVLSEKSISDQEDSPAGSSDVSQSSVTRKMNIKLTQNLDQLEKYRIHIQKSKNNEYYVDEDTRKIYRDVDKVSFTKNIKSIKRNIK